VLETAVCDESLCDECVCGDSSDVADLEIILTILSSGSYPRSRRPENVTRGTHHQLRDAMILAAHLREGRDVLITSGP
jgi:hypothetical protein